MNKRGVFSEFSKASFWGNFLSLSLSLVASIFLSLSLGLGLSLDSSSVSAASFSITTGDDPVLEIKLSSNSVNLDLTPNPNTPVFNTADLTVTAGTNNYTGYQLFLDITDQNLSRNEPLLNGTTPTINSLVDNSNDNSTSYTESTFTTNSWGYRLNDASNPDDTNYYAIPATEQLLSSSTSPVNENTTTITFASKVDMTLPAGDYTTNIVLRAITNSPPPTMQDIDFWQGSLIPDHPIKAQDTRDGKYYNVTKLSSDNRIWMTQNLNLSGGTTLTPTDSNVKENYTLPASETKGDNGNLTNSNAFSGDYDIPYVYNDNTYGGYYNYAAATAGTNPYSGNAISDICPKGWRLPTNDEYNILKTTYTTGEALTAAPWNGTYSGMYYVGAYSGGSGNYWSSTADTDESAFQLIFSNNPSSNAAVISSIKRYGQPVRCIAKNPDVIVTYNANGGTGTMASQNLGEFGGTLSTNTFTRNGYTFAGWNTEPDGSGTPYSNGASYTGSSITLYAQWEHFKMQEVNTWKSTLSTGDVIQVVDTRDNTIYNVSKLADGNIWMLDNLALDLLDSTILNKMTPENTNATAASLTSLKSGNRVNGDKYATAGVSNWTSDYSYSAPLVNMDSKDVIPNNAPTGGKGNNKVGGYYNFCAASAGSYCYGDGTSAGTSSGNATEDICPAGWRMPTGNITGEYAALANQIYGSTDTTNDATARANYRNALSLPLSGYFRNGSANNQGVDGNFWSSTRRDTRNMYNLVVGTSYVSPSISNFRYSGRSVRCLVQ